MTAHPPLVIPRLVPKCRANVSTLKRHAIGAVRYEFEVRMHSIADIKAMFRGLLTPDEVAGLLLKNHHPEVPARMCSLAWLLKQKEKNHVAN